MRMVQQSLLAFVAVAVLAVLGFRVSNNQCSVCGVQEYERSLFGVVIEPLCEREYDEWRTDVRGVARAKQPDVRPSVRRTADRLNDH